MVTRADSGILKTLCAGVGSAASAPAFGSTVGCGHGVATRMPRARRGAMPPAMLLRQPTSVNAGAESAALAAKANFGIFGQREVATISDAGRTCHCCGSVGVAGRSGVAGTTWTMR